MRLYAARPPILDAADTTIIDGYFEVELGAELEIK